MLGAESWVRQLLHGQRAAREILGRQSRAGHNTDAFGFTWSLPKIYAGAGVEAFLTQKLRYNEYTVFEDVLFWWESDDGTRILGVHTYPDHYQEIDPDELIQAARIFHLTSGVYSSAMLFGIGNHGGGPLPDMFERIDDMRRQRVCPQVHLAGMHAYLDHLNAHEADALDRLPVLRDELFLECHHKTYTTQAVVKQRNRQIERELIRTEALCALAGLNAPELLRQPWEIALFNQFHDILPGSSFPMVYQDVHEDYDRAFEIVAAVRGLALRELLGEGEATWLVNTLPWRRPAAAALAGDDLPPCGVVADDAGNHIPFQAAGDDGRAVCVVPEAPALGLRRLGEPVARDLPAMEHGGAWAQNRFFRVELDPARGVISSLKLPDGVELAGDGMGRLDLLEDHPEGFYQSWNMNLTGREDVAGCDGFELVEAGPVRVRFRAKLSFGRWEKKKDFMVPIMWNTPAVDYPTSFFVIDYIVWADLPWIECVMRADWWEDHTDLKVAADTSLSGTRAFYGIAFGQIERPTKRETPYEKARFEVPALSWADLTDGRHGVAILNTGRHGHDALGGRLRLSLLTSPYGGEKVHVVDPLADRGRHLIRYGFYPHLGGPEQGRVQRIAAEFEDAAVVARGGTPAFPVGEDLLAVDPEKVLATAVKPAEDDDGVILRCYEPFGRDAPLEITGLLAAGERTPVDLLEAPADDPADRLGPHQLRSIRIRPERPVPRLRRSQPC
ncbi:MAG: alpha-mannosidase, partial [Planctomycetota bacterium]|jgi:alpha-mannosidase